MARLAFLMLPEAGHLIPTIQLASKMLLKGHEVTFITLPYFEREISARGFRCLSIFSDLFPSSTEDGLFTVISNETRRLTDKALNSYGQGVSVLTRAVATLNPGILFIDRCLAPQVRPLMRDLVANQVIVSTNFGDGLPPLSSVATRAPIEIVLCPAAFDYPRQTVSGSRRVYVDACIFTDRVSQDFPWNSISDEKPLVYCSFGSQISNRPATAQVLREVIHVLAENGTYQIVASVGSLDEAQRIHTQYPGVIAVSTAPQLDILEKAIAIITHGGLGTIKESIMAEVPMFVLPFLYDQPENARRVAYHELGAVLEQRNFSGETFRSSFAKFEDSIPTFRDNLRKMKQKMLAAEQDAVSDGLVESIICETLGTPRVARVSTEEYK